MWKPASIVRARIVNAQRAGSSVNGNPSYFVTVVRENGDFETFRTSSDSACAYDVENLVRATERVWVDLGLTRADRIATITRVPATVRDFEREQGGMVSVDWSDGRVTVESDETFLAWLNAGLAVAR